ARGAALHRSAAVRRCPLVERPAAEGGPVPRARRGLVYGGARGALAGAVRGDLVTGTVQATRQWDRLLDGRYISHASVRSGAVPVCAEPAPPAASMTTAQFVEAAGALAREGRAEFDVPASVTVAQAILESGWGGSQLTANDHNFFGIKCFGWPGSIAVDCHAYRTTECDGAGHCWADRRAVPDVRHDR